MIQRILVPLDGSALAETVLPYGRQLGRDLKVEVQLLRITEPTRHQLERYRSGDLAPEAPTPAMKEAEAYLKRPIRYLESAGCQVASKVTSGVPAADIIAEGEAAPGTLTAMCTHGRSGLTRWLLGSVADKVLHYGSTPLLLTRPLPRSPIAPEPRLASLIIALDGSPVAEEVLPEATALARGLRLDVTLVRATPSLADYLRWTATDVGMPSTDYTRIVEEGDAEAEEYLFQVSSRLRREGASPVRTYLAHGDPADAIITVAAGREGGLVAMTTRGRTGLARTLLGSVADRVVRHCTSPVLLVRPPQGP